MDITPTITTDAQVIQAYGQGAFRISHTLWRGPVLVSYASTQAWNVDSAAIPTAETLAALAATELPGQQRQPEVMLLGLGDQQRFVPPATREAVRAQGVSLEFMATGAACRTYNVLLTEGRAVLAALLPLTEGKALTGD